MTDFLTDGLVLVMFTISTLGVISVFIVNDIQEFRRKPASDRRRMDE
jgi:hypothetical protein